MTPAVDAVVFLGPSLPLAQARAILPGATFLPPARQADLLTAVVNLRPRAVGLIDGVFLHQQSVWHKEILYALERGIWVFGASSLGALRAAETDSFGMIGVGRIYELFASGELNDDDEVALSHGPAADGYRKLSEPMVNVRATLAAAHDAGVISDAEEMILLSSAKELHFSERVFSTILGRGLKLGIDLATARRLGTFVESEYVDLKAQDAALLLETIRDLDSEAQPPPPAHRTALNPGFETMYNRDRQVPAGGSLVALDEIAQHVALHDPDFHDLNFNALNRALSTVLARLVHVEVSPADISDEKQRFRLRHDLLDDASFDGWLTRNHLSAHEFEQLMREAALCRALHRWLIYARFTERTTRLLLDQLRWENQYEGWARRAGSQERLIDGADPLQPGPATDADTQFLFGDHQSWAGVRFDTDAAAWAEEAGFNSESDLRVGLLRSRLARDALLSLLEKALPDNPASVMNASERGA